MKISFYSNALKMAKFYKMAKCVFSWPVHFKNDRSGNPGSYNCTVKLMQELAYSAATGLSLVIIRLLPSSTSDFYVTLPYKPNDLFENEVARLSWVKTATSTVKIGQKAPKKPNTR